MRIILADNHPQALWGLRTRLEEQPEFDLIGEAVDAQGLLKLANNQTADLIIIDRELPGIYIEDLITRLHALEPKPIVIVVSSEIEYGRVLLKLGADAFASKVDEPDWLMEKLDKYAKQIKIKDDANRNKRPYQTTVE